MMIVLCYLPYLLAEALALSGIVAILTAAVVMSHYTHANLSPVTQVTCVSCLSLIQSQNVTFYVSLSFNHKV